MKALKLLPLMLAFTLVLCTVGRSAPGADISPPAPQNKEIVKQCPANALTVFSYEAIHMISDQVTLEKQPAVVPNSKLELSGSVSTKDVSQYREALRRRIKDDGLLTLDKPPKHNKRE